MIVIIINNLYLLLLVRVRVIIMHFCIRSSLGWSDTTLLVMGHDSRAVDTNTVAFMSQKKKEEKETSPRIQSRSTKVVAVGAPCRHAATPQSNNATKQQRHNSTMPQCNNGQEAAQCPNAKVPQDQHVRIPKCQNAKMPEYQDVKLPKGRNAKMSKWKNCQNVKSAKIPKCEKELFNDFQLYLLLLLLLLVRVRVWVQYEYKYK